MDSFMIDNSPSSSDNTEVLKAIISQRNKHKNKTLSSIDKIKINVKPSRKIQAEKQNFLI